MRSMPRPGDGPPHGDHVAPAPPALGRRRPARRLAHVDDRPARSAREPRPCAADGRSTKTVNRCSAGCRESASSNCRANRPNPRRFERQLPSIPILMSGLSCGRLDRSRLRPAIWIRPASVTAGAPTVPPPARGSRPSPRSVRVPGRRGRRSLLAASQVPVVPGRSRPRARSSNNRSGEGERRRRRRRIPCGGPGTRRTRGSRRRSRPGRSRAPIPPRGSRTQRRPASKRQAGQGHARLLVGLDVQSVSTVPVRLIRSIQGTPRRKMSVRTISGRVHRFMWVARTSRASTIRWPARVRR